MLRRRPTPVYELFSEDELFERDPLGAPTGHDPDARCADGEPAGVSAADHAGDGRQAPAFASLDRAHARADARRVLATALAAAGLVGFSVWELLGLATGQPQRSAVPVAQLARPGAPARPSAPGPSRPAHAALLSRAAAPHARVRPSAPRPPLPPAARSAVAADGRPAAAPVAVTRLALSSSAPGAGVLADREFGFER